MTIPAPCCTIPFMNALIETQNERGGTQIGPCDLCGSHDSIYLFEGHDRYYGVPGTFHVRRCTACGLTFIFPLPSSQEISKYYPSSFYYSYRGLKEKRKKTLLEKLAYPCTRLLREINNFLYEKALKARRGVRIIPGGKILDLGCGAGSFLKGLKRKGMDCYGIEIAANAAQIAREAGLQIFPDLFEASFESDTFDAITANHVLEHMREPNKTLKELKRILKPSGTLIIAVPNADSFAFQLFGKYWVQLDIPRHLYTFSQKTLARYLEGNGLRVTKTRYNSTHLQFLGSLLYLFNRFGKKELLLKDADNFLNNQVLKLITFPLVAICNALRKGDAVEFWAQK